VLKQRTANIANQSYQNNAIMKKRSINLNANNDFTTAGMSHMPTKHIPTMAMKSTNGSIGQKKWKLIFNFWLKFIDKHYLT